MSRSLALFAIGLIFGGGAGFVIAAGNGVTFDGHDHANPAQHGGSAAEAIAHDHSTPVELPAGAEAPTVAIEVLKDPMAGWNLHVMKENFEFSPQNASTANVPGQGHAHIYINGTKLGRLYGDWYHLSNLPTGDIEVKVSLNTNSHSPLMVNGIPVEVKTVIQVTE